MSEVLEQLDVRRSPLDSLHERLHATMIERDGWRLPASYGDAAAEYRTVRDGGAGLLDLSSRRRVRVRGSEAVQFLNGLITNDVKALAAGAWMTAAFPNAQGRLLASARVLHQGDEFLFDTEAASGERVFKTLERFTLAGDFHVTDITSDSSTISVQGEGARRVIEATFGRETASLEQGRLMTTEWNGQAVSLIRATHTAEDGFDLFITADSAIPLFESLIASGARPVGFDALERLRVEAGQPRYGTDMDETNVVLEAGLDDAVSYTKGCYIGQEIIARIHWRGHVAKRLAGLAFEDEREVIAQGSKVVTPEGREIGRLTSATFSPRLGRAVALAYIKYDFLAPGTRVRVLTPGDEEREAVVSNLPFVRGSWYGPDDKPETEG